MISRWQITVTDGGDFRKRSREYEIDGKEDSLWKRITEGLIDELIPNCIHHIEIKFRGEGSDLPIYTLNPVMDGETPICQDDVCPNAHKCANHKTAYAMDQAMPDVNRFENGMSPDLYFDTRLKRWGCTKADTNRYEGSRHGAGVTVEESTELLLDQYMMLKVQHQGKGECYSKLSEEVKVSMSESWERLATSAGDPNRARELVLNDARYPKYPGVV